MGASIPTEKLARYRHTAHRRAMHKRAAHRERRRRALAVSGRAAHLLRESFGVSLVFLFGSLAREGIVDDRSDIDLAVEGLDEALYFRALARLLDIDPRIDVDLVMLETAPASLVERVRTEGRPI